MPPQHSGLLQLPPDALSTIVAHLTDAQPSPQQLQQQRSLPGEHDRAGYERCSQPSVRALCATCRGLRDSVSAFMTSLMICDATGVQALRTGQLPGFPARHATLRTLRVRCPHLDGIAGSQQQQQASGAHLLSGIASHLKAVTCLVLNGFSAQVSCRAKAEGCNTVSPVRPVVQGLRSTIALL